MGLLQFYVKINVSHLTLFANNNLIKICKLRTYMMYYYYLIWIFFSRSIHIFFIQLLHACSPLSSKWSISMTCVQLWPGRLLLYFKELGFIRYVLYNHPWPLKVFGFRFISAYNSYIIWGHSMTAWTWRGGR